jgi:hypothetical protein
LPVVLRVQVAPTLLGWKQAKQTIRVTWETGQPSTRGSLLASDGRLRLIILVVFLIGGVANPSPDPLTMVILGGGCAALVEAAELIVWSNDRRRARRRSSPYAGLADDDLSPLAVDDGGTRDGELS